MSASGPAEPFRALRRRGRHVGRRRGHQVVDFHLSEIDPARHRVERARHREAHEILDPLQLAGRLPEPWVAGHDARSICIPLQKLTGRGVR